MRHAHHQRSPAGPRGFLRAGQRSAHCGLARGHAELPADDRRRRCRRNRTGGAPACPQLAHDGTSRGRARGVSHRRRSQRTGAAVTVRGLMVFGCWLLVNGYWFLVVGGGVDERSAPAPAVGDIRSTRFTQTNRQNHRLICYPCCLSVVSPIIPLKNRTSLRYASSALPAAYESTPQSHLLACLDLLDLFLGLKRWVIQQSANPTLPRGAGRAMHEPFATAA